MPNLSARPATDRWQRHGTALTVALLLAVLWSLVLWFSSAQHRRLLAESERALDLMNRALTEQTAGVLRDAESDLRVLEAWIAERPADPLDDIALGRLLRRLDDGSARRLALLRLVTADGALYAPTAEEGPLRRVSGAGMSGPLLPVRDDDGAAVLGAPLETAPGRLALPMVLRLSRPAGRVVALMALVDLDRLMALHEQLRQRPAGAVALVRSDGVALSRVPMLPGLIGTNILGRVPGTPERLAAEHGADVSTASLAHDEVMRLRTYRRVPGYPVSVFVTQGYDDAMAVYHDRRRVILSICAAITAAVLALTAVLLRAQRRAQMRQAELAAVSDESPLGMFRAGLDGRMTYVNEAYLRIQGLRPEEAADGWLRLVRADVRDALWAEWLGVVGGRTPYHAERWLRLPDGRSVLVAVHSNAVVVDDRVVGHVGTVKDITDDARAEKALRTLAAIFDATTDFVVQADPTGRITYLNPAARARMGLPAQAPIGHLTIDAVAPAATVQRYRDEIVPFAVEHGVWIGETVQRDGLRREFPCSHIVIAHKDAIGRLDYFSSIMRDISTDKAAREAAQRSEATMRSVAESIPAIVAVVDRHQRYRYANAAFEAWRGTAREAIVGRTVREVLGEDEYARSHDAIERAIGGEAVMFERLSPAGAGHRHLKLTYLPLRLADGTLDGFIGVAHDITEHRVEQARLLELTRIDPLTGALNRAGFQHALEERTRQRRDGRLALLCIDLDHFKAVNDRHGHPVGDELLKIFVRRLRNAVRPTDAVARIGGDEFAIVLDGLKDPSNAEQVAEKALAAAHAPFRVDGLAVQVGASVGIALWHDGESWPVLVERADAMLYHAKQAGRGRWRAEARTTA